MQGETTTRTEYRVVSTGARSGPVVTHPTTRLLAEAHAATQREAYEGVVRIQQRIVTESSWEDVTDE